MYSFIYAGFKSRLRPEKKAVIVTSQGDPDLSVYEKPLSDFAEVIGFLGFNVVETIAWGMAAHRM